MSDAQKVLDRFSSYRSLIRGAIDAKVGFSPMVESATAVQVERGTIFPAALLDRSGADLRAAERLLQLATSQRLAALAVVDRQGHHRPVYRPLLVYCCLQTFQLLYENLPRADFGRWEEGLRPWCDLLEAELGAIDLSHNPLPAALGANATEAAWIAAALHVAGKVYVRDAWTDLASHTFGRLTRSQQENGAFLTTTVGDSPEMHSYHELVLLHAAASYAVQAEDRTLSSVVARNAEYHLAETQPDHATTQPWGLFALIWNPATNSLADQMLHATRVNSPDPDDGVTFMLLADALYCLQLFEPG